MSGPSQFLSHVVSKWRAGESPDALGVLANHPSLRRDKSLVLDLAYEEFCLRKAAGEKISVGEFCQRFSHHGRSLQRLLEVHEYMADHPGIVGPPDEIAWPSPGDEFLGFGIEKELGRGAFARVFRAKQRNVGNRPVAIKLAWHGTAEAGMMGKLSHPNIVPVFMADIDVDTGLTVVCMPYLGEKTLEDVLALAYVGDCPPPLTADVIDRVLQSDTQADQPADPPQAKAAPTRYVDAVASMMLHLADALRCTHEKGILHRDLKPSNVLLKNDGTPMLLDFNLSVDAATEVSRLGGTLPYMSPEQIKQIFFREDRTARSAADGEPATDPAADIPDGRSDLFSLGVVIYELLTGKLPFGKVDGQNVCREEAQSLYQRQQRGAMPIRQQNIEVDPELAEILHSCLQFDPDHRPATAKALCEALDRYLSRAGRVRRVLHRNRFAVGSLATAAAILLTIAGIWFVTRPPYYMRVYEQGVASFEQGNYAEAIESFSTAIDKGEPSAEIYYARAMARLRENDASRALDDLHNAVRINPQGIILSNLAYCYAQLERYGEAVRYGEKAIEAGYRSAILYNNLGRAYLELVEDTKAKEALDLATSLDPFLAEAYHNRACLFFRKIHQDLALLDAAESDVDRALALNTSSGEVLIDAASIYAERAKANPNHHRAVRRLITHALQQGMPVQWIESRPALARYCGTSWYQDLRGQFEKNPERSVTLPFVPPSTEIRLR